MWFKAFWSPWSLGTHIDVDAQSVIAAIGQQSWFISSSATMQEGYLGMWFCCWSLETGLFPPGGTSPHLASLCCGGGQGMPCQPPVLFIAGHFLSLLQNKFRMMLGKEDEASIGCLPSFAFFQKGAGQHMSSSQHCENSGGEDNGKIFAISLAGDKVINVEVLRFALFYRFNKIIWYSQWRKSDHGCKPSEHNYWSERWIQFRSEKIFPTMRYLGNMSLTNNF